jgi:internalin A
MLPGRIGGSLTAGSTHSTYAKGSPPRAVPPLAICALEFESPLESRTMIRQGRDTAFRFRLQTLFVLVTALIVPIALVSQELHREKRKKQIMLEVRQLGGRAREAIRSEDKPTGVVNGYLRLCLGDDYFTEVWIVELTPRTAEDLKLLFYMPEMKQLTIGGDALTDDSLKKLRRLKDLEYLSLHDTRISEHGLAALANLENLQSIQFSNCELADNFLGSLASAPALNSLSFDGCSMSNHNLETLSEFSKLQTLSIRNCSLDDADLKILNGSQSLTKLNLMDTQVTEAGILAIREANPTWSVTSKNQIPNLQEIQQATRLELQGSRITDATLASLKDAQQLTSLRLSKCDLSDDSLKHLKPLRRLESLVIHDIPISDTGLRELADLPKLRALRLIATKVEGNGLECLPASLRGLSVIFSNVSNTGVASIAALKSLENLTLVSKSVSDEAVDDLAKMTSLRHLQLGGTGISPAGFARLRQALPDCEIISD